MVEGVLGDSTEMGRQLNNGGLVVQSEINKP